MTTCPSPRPAVRRTRSRWLLAPAGVAAALLLSSCSSGHTGHTATSAGTAAPTSAPSYGPAATGDHNDADATFASDMIPHHQQAVEMSEMALSRTTDAQVKALAATIKAAQAPEIAQMGGWLLGWGGTVPTGSAHSGHAMSGMTTSDGMMSEDEMSALDAASGTRFAKLWLTGMIRHHEGAVAMARAEQSGGVNPEARALATRIISSQSAEIAAMTRLLAALG